VELIPESDRMILAEQEEDLYLDKYPESLPLKDLPEEIKQINQKPRFNNNVGGNMNANNTKTIKNDTYVDRDSMIDIPLVNGKLQTKDVKPVPTVMDTADSNKKETTDAANDEMLLNGTEEEHPVMVSSGDLTNSINDAMNNSNSLMMSAKSNISKLGFMERNKEFLKTNVVGIILILILLIALVKLFIM
jgi:hypothetical protein